MATIVLAHGLFGFGNLFGSRSSVEAPLKYFRNVAAHLRARGLTVHEPSLPPIGRVSDRGKILGEWILAQTTGPVDIIAHSMGGLDARFALRHVPGLAARVRRLTTIGTPHHGSPLADALYIPGDPMADYVPAFLAANKTALIDLTSKQADVFNAETPDVSDVEYRNVAGDALSGVPSYFHLFALALVANGHGVNDGVVARRSAHYPGHRHLPDWPVDHAGELGWNTETLRPLSLFLPFHSIDHLSLYDTLV